MPPEQQRDAATVDHRADIYAAGATLYALVTARRPTALLTGDRERAIGLLPAEVRPIVRRATEVHRRDRYETAQAMEEALRELQARVPLPPGVRPVVDQPGSPPSVPPDDGDVTVDPDEIAGTERAWAGVTLDRTSPPTLSGAPVPSGFRAIDPSADSSPGVPEVVPAPRRSRIALGMGFVVLFVLCAGGASLLGTLGVLGVWFSG
jgi:serine/threonine protein kinase